MYDHHPSRHGHAAGRVAAVNSMRLAAAWFVDFPHAPSGHVGLRTCRAKANPVTRCDPCLGDRSLGESDGFLASRRSPIRCPLSGVERTSAGARRMSANDPEPT
jgi:hypothetical protein